MKTDIENSTINLEKYINLSFLFYNDIFMKNNSEGKLL